MKSLRHILCSGIAALALVAMAPAANAQSLHSALVAAVGSNPEIGAAEQNREAIEWELRQAVGLFAPEVNLEASAGVGLLSNPSRRAAGIDDDPLYPSQIGLSLSYDIFDGGFRQSEVDLQAARVDGASFRVLERSEFVALQVSRLYFEIMLQRRIIDLSGQNVAFHQFTLDNVGEAISSGQLTEADRLQAIERLAASRARVIEAREELENARIEFERYVGVALTSPTMPAQIGSALPNSLEQAINLSRENNPLVLLAGADLDAAAALATQSESALLPQLSLEGNAGTGFDLGGLSGHTSDFEARVVLRFNLFDGGVRSAQTQESYRRESEALLGLHQAHREVEEAVRLSWTRLGRQREIASVYGEQLSAASDLVTSYQDQFSIGERSLLDVLDAQNTRYNLQIIYETARYSYRFAEYRLMAASGQLLPYLGITAPDQADAYARDAFAVPAYSDYPDRPLATLDLGLPGAAPR